MGLRALYLTSSLLKEIWKNKACKTHERIKGIDDTYLMGLPYRLSRVLLSSLYLEFDMKSNSLFAGS
jgi:hypothetical protein